MSKRIRISNKLFEHINSKIDGAHRTPSDVIIDGMRLGESFRYIPYRRGETDDKK